MTSIFLADHRCEGVDFKTKSNLFYFDSENTNICQAFFWAFEPSKNEPNSFGLQKAYNFI